MSVRDYNVAVDFIDRQVLEGRAEKIAFIDPSRTITYRELSDAAARVGPMLARLGVEQENRIALVLLDTVDFPILFWGAIRAGVAPVLMNTRLTVDQYRYLLEDSRAKVAFVSPALLPAVEEAAAGLPHLREIVVVGGGPPGRLRFDALLGAEKQGAAPARTCVDDVAYWLYSSGTTGMPKGVMHVHGAPRFMAQSAGVERIGYREDDVVFSAAKLFFAYGIGSALICPNWVGATTVLYPERPTPRTVFETLRAFDPTLFFAVPTLYAAILADAGCQPETASRKWRLCFSAGEPLPAHVGEAWKQRFGIDIVNGVGSSEGGHLFLTNTPGAVDYRASGTPLRNFDLELRDDAGDPVAEGEPGELWVRSATIAAGYWNQLEKTRRTFVGGWLRTGDNMSAVPTAPMCSMAAPTTCSRSRNLGLALRSRGCADEPSPRAGGGRRPGRGSRRPRQAEGLRRARRTSARRGARAVRGTQGFRQEQHRSVEIPALDRIRRRIAEDGERQDPALPAARRLGARLRYSRRRGETGQ